MNTTSADSENIWLWQAANDDRHAFGELCRLYLDSLYQFVFLFTRSTACTERIVQELFVRIWEERKSLRERESFKSFLFDLAKCRMMDYVRGQEAVEAVFS